MATCDWFVKYNWLEQFNNRANDANTGCKNIYFLEFMLNFFPIYTGEFILK